MAREMGFTHIQAATNGIELADLEFAQKPKPAGLATPYLQFDGVTDNVYRRTRGRALFETKLTVVENCRATSMKIVFVPTIMKRLNDHQIGDIVRVAIDNIDTVSGISFQPVAFTGRIAKHKLLAKRSTLADLARCVGEQTGIAKLDEDWFPLACIKPFSKLTSAVRGTGVPIISSHPHCCWARTSSLTRERSRRSQSPSLSTCSHVAGPGRAVAQDHQTVIQALLERGVWNILQRHFHQDKAPRGLTSPTISCWWRACTSRTAYNYDIERVKRWVVHYATPDGKVYPLCTCNSGPCYREKIERQFSIP